MSLIQEATVTTVPEALTTSSSHIHCYSNSSATQDNKVISFGDHVTDVSESALSFNYFIIPSHIRPYYVAVGSLGLALNLFVSFVLVKHKSERPSKTECLILHQVFVDMATALLAIVTAVVPPPGYYDNQPPTAWDEIVCRVWAPQVSTMRHIKEPI